MAEDLFSQNAQLEAEIKALEKQLDKGEVKRFTHAEQVFRAFDAKNDGKFSINEFRLMAFQSGAAIHRLTDDAVRAAFEKLSQGAEGLTLASFYQWLVASETTTQPSPFDPELLRLRAKLQSQAFVRTLGRLREFAASSEGKKKLRTKHKPDKVARQMEVKVEVGTFEEAKAGCQLSFGSDKAAAAEARAVTKAPEGTRSLIYVDIPIMDEASPAEVEGMVSTLKTLLDNPSLDLGGLNVITSRSVAVVSASEKKKQGAKVIRAVLTSNQGPLEVLKAKAKGTLEAVVVGALEGREKDGKGITGYVAVELPTPVFHKAKEEGNGVNDSDVKVRMQAKVSVASSMIATAQNLLETYGKRLQKTASSFHALLVGVRFFRNMTVELGFSTPKEFLEWIPSDVHPSLDKAKAQLSKAYSKVKNAASSGNPSASGESLGSLVSTVLGKGGIDVRDYVPGVVAKLFETASRISNPAAGAKLQFQVDNYVVALQFRGMDWAQLNG